MKMKTSTVLLKCSKYITEEIRPGNEEEPVTDRQERVIGFDQSKFGVSTVSLIGAGGINSEAGDGLIRKGIGCLKIFDHDTVALSNLNRQKFYKEDLYKNKALCLAKNLAKEAIKKSTIIGYPFTFQRAVEEGIDINCNIAICGVDNNKTRVYAASHFYKAGIPLIVIGVSRDANNGYVFVQEPDKACFGCAFPESINDALEPCPNTPAIKDILKVVAGLALYAVDTVIMDRKRDWNYRMIYLSGFAPDSKRCVERNKNCPLCK